MGGESEREREKETDRQTDIHVVVNTRQNYKRLLYLNITSI